jgi:hypothetical protein
MHLSTLIKSINNLPPCFLNPKAVQILISVKTLHQVNHFFLSFFNISTMEADEHVASVHGCEEEL